MKRIINDNGGTAVVGDFGITTDAGTLSWDGGVADGTATLKYTSNRMEVAAGPYTFSELMWPATRKDVELHAGDRFGHRVQRGLRHAGEWG